MDNLGPLKLIKAGFWFGIGLLLPIVALVAVTIGAMTLAASHFENQMRESMVPEGYVSGTSGQEATENLNIRIFKEASSGSQLVVLGALENAGGYKVNNVQLEVELFDSNKLFVYECKGYVQNTILPGNKENFQITCGCGESPVPRYSEMTVRVASAFAYE